MSAAVAQLKQDMAHLLRSPEQVHAQEGLATGWSALDHFTLWRGFPKGALSLLYGRPGLGATSLWMQCASKVTTNKGWAAWLSGSQSQLCPWALKREGLDFSRLLHVSAPKDEEHWLWALQEILSLSLFDVIGCDLGPLRLREHQLLKLKRMAQQSRAALVVISPREHLTLSAQWALAIRFQRGGTVIERALHRPTPHTLTQRSSYADFMPQLAEKRTPLGGRSAVGF